MSQARPAAPLVAIVTPVYNGAKFLAETMECVQKLDYPNLLHIVLDNASTDATPEIISRFRNGRVPILLSRNQTTLSLVANFNAAVSMVPAEAKYFRLLCADDTMTPNAISQKVDVAERDPDIGIVGCRCRVDSRQAEGFRGNGLPKNCEIFDGREVIRDFLRRENDVLHGTEVLVRRSKLGEQPSYYDVRFQGAADTDANIRICLNSKFGFVHEDLTTARQHESNHFTGWSRSHFHMAEWLMLLERYGRFALNDREYQDCRFAFRRHYLRRLLLVRWRDGDKATFDRNMTMLRRNNDPASWLDFSDALADWAFLALTRRRHLAGLAKNTRIRRMAR